LSIIWLVLATVAVAVGAVVLEVVVVVVAAVAVALVVVFCAVGETAGDLLDGEVIAGFAGAAAASTRASDGGWANFILIVGCQSLAVAVEGGLRPASRNISAGELESAQSQVGMS
jgi:hypothetical protein